jgi:hypothetical protein
MSRDQVGDFEEEPYLSFWKAGRKYFLQTNDPATVRQVRRWSFCRQFAAGYNCYLRVFSVPSRQQAWVRKMLQIPRRGDVRRLPVRPDRGNQSQVQI